MRPSMLRFAAGSMVASAAVFGFACSSNDSGGGDASGGGSSLATIPTGSAGKTASVTELGGGSGGAPTASTAGSGGAKTGEVITPPSTTAGAGGAACVGADGTFYGFTENTLSALDPIPLCTYAQNVVLVVNTASKCGFTPQYGPLQAIYEQYKDQGFVILGFPCNQFGGQESGTDEDISSFCTQNYGIEFPMFTKIDVNGADADPLYVWLKTQPASGGADVAWNFEKFLISRDGTVVDRYLSAVTPDDPTVIAAIEAELAKPRKPPPSPP